jgi:hypothetical protein
MVVRVLTIVIVQGITMVVRVITTGKNGKSKHSSKVIAIVMNGNSKRQ